MDSFNKILEDKLNVAQKTAVEYNESPQLIFAGAGSGKTRVLTNKIAFLIQHKICPPHHILAVTFTNKAANEMKQRLEKMIGDSSKFLNIGTFHSICARILRADAEKLGFQQMYSIYDDADQVNLIKKIMKRFGISEKEIHPRQFRSFIEKSKQKMLLPEDVQENPKYPLERTYLNLYGEYQKELKIANAMDFNDLLIYPLKIFESHPEILVKYQKRFQYVLVDEYQDTNMAQFRFVESLAKKHRKLAVVGDDDQSIYGWRGADIANILQFKEHFPDAKIFKLEQNYRSTKNILTGANTIILNNQNRAEKSLWTDGEIGEPIQVVQCDGDRIESDEIVRILQENIFKQKRKFSDFAILYRTNAQSRILEEGLRRIGIPYTIVGGIRFYDRKEIKDVMAYLKFAVNPKDNISIKRIINVPPRGIGRTTQDRIESYAEKHGISIFEALGNTEDVGIGLVTKKKVDAFYTLITKFVDLSTRLNGDEFAQIYLEETGLLKYLQNNGTELAANQLENIHELLNGITEFCQTSESKQIAQFIEEVSLYTDIDQWNDHGNQITLMTLHSAKGLEFPVVFIAGVEDGLLPHIQSIEKQESLDEERRLFYVGMTRARQELFLTYAMKRYSYDGVYYTTPSRFLSELPENVTAMNYSKIKEKVKTTYCKEVKNSHSHSSTFEERSIGSEWKIGQFVQHRTFGKGKIVSVEGNGDSAKISIIFHGNIRKKLIAKYANLTPV